MADQDEVTVHLTVTANQEKPRIPLVVAKTDTAAALFGKVSDATSIPRASLKLIFRGRLIPDDASKQAVTEFKMEEGSVLHCMGKPAGTNGATSAGGASAPSAAVSSTGTSAAMPAAAAAAAAAAAGSTFTFQPSAAAASAPATPPADPLAAALASLRGSNSAADYSTAVTTLEKVLSNIISHPMEDKYRKVKKQNPAFQRRLGGLAAGDAAMKAAGFVTQTADGEEVYMMEASAEAWPSLLRTKAAVDAAAREAKAAANQSSAPPQPAGMGGMGGMPGMPGMPAGGGMPNTGGGMPQGMPAGMGGQDMQSAVANLMADPNALQSMMQNPMVQQMLRNDPRFANNPQLLEQVQQLASNPAMAGQLSQMMRDPQMMQQMQTMMQQNGGQMPTSMPGGMGGGMQQGGFGGAGAGAGAGAGNAPAQPGAGAGANQGQQPPSGGATDEASTEDEMIAEAIRRSLQDDN